MHSRAASAPSSSLAILKGLKPLGGFFCLGLIGSVCAGGTAEAKGAAAAVVDGLVVFVVLLLLLPVDGGGLGTDAAAADAGANWLSEHGGALTGTSTRV